MVLMNWFQYMRQYYLDDHSEDIVHFMVCELDAHQRAPYYMPSVKWIKYCYKFSDGLFPVSKARNIIIKTGFDYDKICLWDLDVIITPDHFCHLIDTLRTTTGFVKGYSYFCFSDKEKIDSLDENDWMAYLAAAPSPSTKIISPLGAGITGGDRTAFLKTKGYDERFTGWGYEDDAFGKRVIALGLDVVTIDRPLLHLWHPQGTQHIKQIDEKSAQVYEHNNQLFKELYSDSDKILSDIKTLLWEDIGKSL